jgi:hypothetical protein
MFRRNDTFVALKPIRLSSTARLLTGTKIESGKFPLYQLLNWYRKNLIAQYDCGYANEYLRVQALKHKKVVAEVAAEVAGAVEALEEAVEVAEVVAEVATETTLQNLAKSKKSKKNKKK